MNFNGNALFALAIALLLFPVGQRSVRRCATKGGRLGVLALWLLLAVPGFLFPLYYLHWFDDAKWYCEFRSFPFAEFTAGGAGLFAGGLAELAKPSQLFSPWILAAILCLGLAAPYLKPVLSPLPDSRFADRWKDGVCLQSTPSSCGAASAATVFKMLGMDLGERQIARECYTYSGGTENWYIARTFRRRGYSVNYRIGNGLPADLHTPAIAGVRVGGFGHFIAILDRSNGEYSVGDPLVGSQKVPEDCIAEKFDFTGFFMEIR